MPVQSNLNISAWRKYEPIFVEHDKTLVDQLEFGFTMGIDPSVHIDIPVTNHPSARQNYTVIDEFLIKPSQNQCNSRPLQIKPL